MGSVAGSGVAILHRDGAEVCRSKAVYSPAYFFKPGIWWSKRGVGVGGQAAWVSALRREVWGRGRQWDRWLVTSDAAPGDAQKAIFQSGSGLQSRQLPNLSSQLPFLLETSVIVP